MLSMDSLASAVRLYNWASIRCTPWQDAVLHAAAKRIVLCPGGGNATAQLPAVTVASTALIPLSSRPAPGALSRFVVFTPAPHLAPAAMATSGLRTISVCMRPVNTNEGEAATAALRRLMLVVLPQLQRPQQSQEPAALTNYRDSSKALVRFDHSSGTSKALLPLFSSAFSCALPAWLDMCSLPPTISGGKIAALGNDPFSGGAFSMWSFLVPTSPSGTVRDAQWSLEVRVVAVNV